MATEKKQDKNKAVKYVGNQGGGGAVYGMGVIGALFYYISNAGNFWEVIVGIFKSLFWPAVLVYEALKYFQL